MTLTKNGALQKYGTPCEKMPKGYFPRTEQMI